MAKGNLGALALAFAFVAGPAVADPPTVGADYTFAPTTVVCDAIGQIRDIATAADPDNALRLYNSQTNDVGEPVCATMAISGRAEEVVAVGIMQVGNRYFRAYAVRISSGQAELWALALEHLEGFTRA